MNDDHSTVDEEWESIGRSGDDVESEGLADGGDEFEFRSSDVILFEGDQGTLNFEARSALVAVLKNNYVSHDRHPKVWVWLVKYRRDVESRLNELFLELMFDVEHGLAYKQQVPNKRFPTVMSTPNRAYTWTETILLRHLREIYGDELGRDGNANVVVSRAEMLERLQNDKSSRSNDEAAQSRDAEKAFAALVSADILISMRDSDGDRFRISPVIVPLVSVDKLRALSDFLDRLDNDENSTEGDAPSESSVDLDATTDGADDE